MTRRGVTNSSAAELVRRQRAARSHARPATAAWPMHEDYRPAVLTETSGGEQIASIFVMMCAILGPLMLLGIYSIVFCGWLLTALIWLFVGLPIR
jgi:hypothetical protein